MRTIGDRLPDARGRTELLCVVPLAVGIDAAAVGERTPGLVAADLVALRREATVRAAPRHSSAGQPELAITDGYSQHDRKDAAVMTDHPSWLCTNINTAYRAVRCGTSVWALACTPGGSGGHETTAHLVSGAGGPPVADVLDPATLTGPKAVVIPLREVGTVARWRNPDVWDALATSIVRQVIRADQARKSCDSSRRRDAVRLH